jgi:glucose/mannose transport system permease protein
MATAATQASAGSAQVIRTGAGSRFLIYTVLIIFCVYYLLPLYVMVVNSLKPLSEIQAGGMMSLPQAWTVAPWASAWSTAQVGVQATGLRPYFLNSILMVVPAVALSTILGALNGYVLTKWRFRGDTIIFGLMGIAGTVAGLVFVHLVYGIGFSTLYFRNYYAQFPTELVRAAMIDGAGFFTIFRRIMLPSSGPIAVVCVIWQFTNIWNDFLFGASFSDFDSQPMTVALNNLVQSSTGVKEYNVHFAGAIMAALPTLLVYIVAGRYFVRGLMAGSVKG